MAIATRQAQPKRRVDGWKSVTVKTVVSLEVDGRTEARFTLAQRRELVPETTYVAQEDRITLDLSLAEAQAIKSSLVFSSNSKAKGIVVALRDALAPIALSSIAGTGASSGQGTAAGSLLRPAVDLSAKIAEGQKAASTTGCGGSSPLAQLAAQKRDLEHEMRRRGLGNW
jgi:hypothetical protein